MGNACTNCSQCKGDAGENSEIVTLDNKVCQIYILSNQTNQFNQAVN